MNDWEKLLIVSEKYNVARRVCILDNHHLHIREHLKSFWRCGMIKHIWEHFRAIREKEKLGLSHINSQDIFNHISNPDRWF